MAGKTDLKRLNCSLARALGSVGDWWTLLIVRDAFFGSARFSEFQQSLGIARNILADRLDGLVTDGILAREGTAERPRYVLTQKGAELLPALVALMQWGDKWQSAGSPPVILTDDAGRALTRMQVENGEGEAVTARTLRFRAGPGADERTKRFIEGANTAVPCAPRARKRGAPRGQTRRV